jgi:hypothetical protein
LEGGFSGCNFHADSIFYCIFQSPSSHHPVTLPSEKIEFAKMAGFTVFIGIAAIVGSVVRLVRD